MPGSMRLAFLACLGAMALLHVTLCRLELVAKRVRARARRVALHTDHAAVAPPSPPRPRAVARPADPVPAGGR